jgi:hypothetical protein
MKRSNIGFIHEYSLDYAITDFYKVSMRATSPWYKDYFYYRVFNSAGYSTLIMKEIEQKLAKCVMFLPQDELCPSDERYSPTDLSKKIAVFGTEYTSTVILEANLPDVQLKKAKPVDKQLGLTFLLEDLVSKLSSIEIKVLAYMVVELDLQTYILDYSKLQGDFTSYIDYFSKKIPLYINDLIEYVGSSRRVYKAKESLKQVLVSEFSSYLNK